MSRGAPLWRCTHTGVTKAIRGVRGTSRVSFNDHAHLEYPDGSLVTYR
jgi:hypothetical protein